MFSKRSLGLFSRCYKPGPRGRRFISGPSIEILDRLGLVFASHLAPPNHHPTRAMESIAQGGEMYMTSEEMYRHLNYIQGFVSPESRTHFQIETDIFRASAMLGGDRRMALKTDDGARPLEVPLLKRSGIRKLSGPTGYNVGVVANAKKVPNTPQIQPWEEPVGLFIAKAKYQEISHHLPRIVTKMYAVATQHKKKVIRGVISDGHRWVFLILLLNKNCKGGVYWVTPEVPIGSGCGPSERIEAPEPDILAGILAHWVQHCCDDTTWNDWFERWPVIIGGSPYEDRGGMSSGQRCLS